MVREYTEDTENSDGSDASEAVRPPTSTDVARLARVSQSTVSHVLNNVPNNRFTQETRDRVLAAAEALGYVPHAMARSLRFGHSNLVLMPVFDWPFNPDSFNFFQILSARLHELGYTVMMQAGGPWSMPEAARTWAALRPSGVFIPSENVTRQIVDVLRKAGTEVILALGAEVSPLVPTVVIDFTATGECAAQHLLSRGHRHLAVVVPRDPRILKIGLQRLRGVEKAGQACGARVDRLDLDYSSEEASELAAKWKRRGHPTGVFAFNDEYGALLMGALHDVGLSVPGDVALIGCDNLPICNVVRPRLTSISTSSTAAARAIAAYFDASIQGRSIGEPPEALSSPQLVVRDSS